MHRISAPEQQPQHNAAPAATGDNPLDTPCLDDAKIVTSTNKNPQFLLEIVFSAKCHAAWARIPIGCGPPLSVPMLASLTVPMVRV